jgi:hypothetical protein
MLLKLGGQGSQEIGLFLEFVSTCSDAYGANWSISLE